MNQIVELQCKIFSKIIKIDLIYNLSQDRLHLVIIHKYKINKQKNKKICKLQLKNLGLD